MLSLRLHVPIEYILTYIGTPLRLKYLLQGYMEPLGLGGALGLWRPQKVG